MKNFALRRLLDPGLLLTLALTLFLVMPLAQNPGLPKGFDTLWHSYRVAELKRSWEHGVYFPSWAESMYFGYGSPVFHFYARLAYVLAAMLQVIFGLDTLNAMRCLLLVCVFTCSGGMYLFCKRRSGRLGALIAGLAYVYSPYLMVTEAYVRGAYPELLAFALFPLLLWRIDSLRDKPTAVNFLIVCLLQAALINAHNLMAVALTGIAFAWVIFETMIQQLNREASQLDAGPGVLALLALLLGSFAAATFWLPILLESDSVQLENLLVPGILDFRVHFVSLSELLSPAPIQDAGAINGLRLIRQLGIAQWGLALIGSILALLLYIRGFRARHPQAFLGSAYFALLAAALIFLALPASGEMWEGIRPLQFLQFPWRLLGPIAACLAIVASMNGLWLSRLAVRIQSSVIALIIALPIVTVIPLLYVPEWRLPTLDASISAFHAEELEGHGLGTTATNEFLPRDSEQWPWASWSLMTDYWDGYPIDKLNRETLPAGAEAELLHNAPQSLAWRVKTEVSFVAEIYNLYWLGWQAELDGRPLKITPSPHHGFITVPLPAGEYTLRVYLGSTPARDVATAVSTLAIACACYVAWLLRNPQLTPRPYWTVLPLTRTEVIGVLLGGAIAILCLLITFREGVAWINSPPGVALPAQVHRVFTLDGYIQLLGYSLNDEEFQTGDTLIFDLYWYALEAPEVNFSSFAHLSTSGAVYAQIDKPPGVINTRGWGPQAYFYDRYELQLPGHLPAGEYKLIIGLYTCELMPPDDCGNGYRPTVTDENGDMIGDSITLTSIRVDSR